ncbi:MAG: hypothetical protein HYW57_02420 [Ignavibacteriales bacterium]|nr:hypothetical protein [Ignavibacteriales bacterium]
MNVPENISYTKEHEWIRMDLYAPVSGQVTDVNKKVQETPEVVNKEPYDGGWMIKVKLDHPAEATALLDAGAYKKLIAKT